ncbi:YdcF family protein [Lachnospiraceae bacterium MD308]|nr:YdcF family protein [Lachnospiraceae bacterium MD308]MCI8581288.1 DUF218 domain-containing protein [Dorea sp.]
MRERCKRIFEPEKLIKIFLAFIVVIAAAVLGINGFVKMTAGKRITAIEQLQEGQGGENQIDAVLVLGAQVRPDGSLSKMLKERLDTGISIYKSGITDRMIMSGDHGRDDYDEVNAMKSYAIEQGVPSECIFMDHAGFSTYESMYRAKEIFEAENLIVVTQKYHMYRALYDAKALGIEAKGVTCDTRVYSGDKYRKLREAAARIKDVGYTIAKPKPTYLGDVIPVTGNGNVTNDKPFASLD